MDVAVPSCIKPKDKSEKWFFSAERLNKTPSIVKGGFDPEKELRYRQQSAGFVQEMGEKLNHNVKDARARISQLCLCTAMVYMHRFYVFHSFTVFDPRDAAAAALFLAAKVEECPRKLEHIVKVWYLLKHPSEPQPLDTKSEQYMAAAQLLTTYENLFLQTIAFDLEVQTPHIFVIKNCQMVMRGNRDLAEAAYWFASDILHLTNFCVRYRPSVIACVCIHLACSWANWEIPVSQEGKKWFQYQDPDVTDNLLKTTLTEFVGILRMTIHDKFSSEEDVRKLCRQLESVRRALSRAPEQQKDTGGRLLCQEFVDILHKAGDRLRLKGHAYLGKKAVVGHTSPGKAVPELPNPPHPPPGPSGAGPATMMIQEPSTSAQNKMMEVPHSGPVIKNNQNMKRVKTEPTVLDLNRYKERRPPAAEQTPVQQNQKRESFLPDMSTKALFKEFMKDQPRTPEKNQKKTKDRNHGMNVKDSHPERPKLPTANQPSSMKRPHPEGGHPPQETKHKRPDMEQERSHSRGQMVSPREKERPGSAIHHKDKDPQGRPREPPELQKRKDRSGMPPPNSAAVAKAMARKSGISEELDREIRKGLEPAGNGEPVPGRSRMSLPNQPGLVLQKNHQKSQAKPVSSHHPLLNPQPSQKEQNARWLAAESSRKTDSHNRSIRDQFLGGQPRKDMPGTDLMPVQPRKDAPVTELISVQPRSVKPSANGIGSVAEASNRIPPPPLPPQPLPMDLEEGEIDDDEEDPPLPPEEPPRPPPPPAY